MQEKYRYSKKHVHDIRVGESFVRLWHHGGDINKKLIKRIFQKILNTESVSPYIALMPDYHQSGDTMTGSVIPVKDGIIPSVIGNDIGCGMLAVRLPVELGDLNEPERLLFSLKREIPVGTSQNRMVNDRVANNCLWQELERLTAIKENDIGRLMRQVGSLGGGNHFLELLKDTEGDLWLVIHTGSRYTGELIRRFYTERVEMQEEYCSFFQCFSVNSPEGQNYLTDHDFAVRFARLNRLEILYRTLSVLSVHTGIKELQNTDEIMADHIDVVHNAVTFERHFGEDVFVHRKGAVRLMPGKTAVVPGSMGTLSYIVEGRDTCLSFNSCSHGAGRRFSRGEAMRNVSLKEFRKSMKGIVYDTSINLKDEAPQAYKDIKHVMKGQKDLVKILHELTPVVSLKG